MNLRALAILLLACGRPAGPDATTATDTAHDPVGNVPPAANVLPDGGTTPDGGPASDADRLIAAIEWFAPRVKTCSVSTYNAGVTHNYTSATMDMTAVSESLILSWRLTGGAGASAVDTSVFELNLGTGAAFKVETTPTATELTWQMRLGWPESLTVHEEQHSVWLLTFDESTHTSIRCDE